MLGQQQRWWRVRSDMPSLDRQGERFVPRKSFRSGGVGKCGSMPFIDGDALAWYIDGTPIDVTADPTGRQPTIRLVGIVMTPARARDLAATLLAAAAYCEGQS